MKVAFHFDTAHKGSGTWYSKTFDELFLRLWQNEASPDVSSKVFTGDLLLHNLGYKREVLPDRELRTFERERFNAIVEEWMGVGKFLWGEFHPDRLFECLGGRIYTICVESIDFSLAQPLHERLVEQSDTYLGALEVDETSEVHWYVYSLAVGARYRVRGKSISLFWDGYTEESKDESTFRWLSHLGFREVTYEDLHGKYTIFDEYHDFDQVRRVADWKRRCGNLLAFIADDVVSRLGDVAPDLGSRLWAILQTFEAAEVNEQYAQVTASCRRVIEYVADQVFPPAEEQEGSRKLGQLYYRNRLLAFAEAERKSDTNINLICVSMDSLADQMDKLAKLANKGVHSDVVRAEARRCMLRTILVLDDIISLNSRAFPMKPKLNTEDWLRDLIGPDSTD